MPYATLVHDGELFTPEPRGRGSVLAIDGEIVSVALGKLDARVVERSLQALGIELRVLPASGLAIAPGLIHPHKHLLGDSDAGVIPSSPATLASELVGAGITTVVGALSAGSSMRTPAELLAAVEKLREEGLSAYMYSGGSNLPPMSVSDSVRDDLLYIDAVIGCGAIALAGRPAGQFDAGELAAFIVETYAGGMLNGKAGVTHLCVGEGDHGQALIRAILDEFGVEPCAIYAAHASWTQEPLRDAVRLTKRGVFVSVDTGRPLRRSLQMFADCGGDLRRLTLSPDAGPKAHDLFLDDIAGCVSSRWPLERMLPLVTSNTARALKLPGKGRLATGSDADVLALRPGSLEPVHVVRGGRILMEDGRAAVCPVFLHDDDRNVRVSDARPRRERAHVEAAPHP